MTGHRAVLVVLVVLTLGLLVPAVASPAAARADDEAGQGTITLEDGRFLTGRITRTDSGFRVETADGRSVRVRRDEVASVRIDGKPVAVDVDDGSGPPEPGPSPEPAPVDVVDDPTTVADGTEVTLSLRDGRFVRGTLTHVDGGFRIAGPRRAVTVRANDVATIRHPGGLVRLTEPKPADVPPPEPAPVGDDPSVIADGTDVTVSLHDGRFVQGALTRVDGGFRIRGRRAVTVATGEVASIRHPGGIVRFPAPRPTPPPKPDPTPEPTPDPTPEPTPEPAEPPERPRVTVELADGRFITGRLENTDRGFRIHPNDDAPDGGSVVEVKMLDVRGIDFHAEPTPGMEDAGGDDATDDAADVPRPRARALPAVIDGARVTLTLADGRFVSGVVTNTERGYAIETPRRTLRVDVSDVVAIEPLPEPPAPPAPVAPVAPGPLPVPEGSRANVTLADGRFLTGKIRSTERGYAIETPQRTVRVATADVVSIKPVVERSAPPEPVPPVAPPPLPVDEGTLVNVTLLDGRFLTGKIRSTARGYAVETPQRTVRVDAGEVASIEAVEKPAAGGADDGESNGGGDDGSESGGGTSDDGGESGAGEAPTLPVPPGARVNVFLRDGRFVTGTIRTTKYGYAITTPTRTIRVVAEEVDRIEPAD